MRACKYNNIKIVEYLLTLKGIDVNAKSRKGNTALHYACINESIGIILLLLSYKGIDKNAKNSKGLTPFQMTRNPEIQIMLNSH
ncbi:ankyrin repeat protein, putative [Trichomonas vaginalis G3]|uniref:Ankyrin repeat protein, putative n=1 Tax=Trichomonas vaginalis (strain ATCC PRA-98 / G3) TaxID=412133 RepID=A2FGD8_TRIV3|nr:Ankyrin repeat family [Trichomonas vaginalis G3]EAX96042.1 ankyrin repeat protein, putative [Trichomonas vaginalis G3]KAI5491749.1 Ankyrin repeat family [Trichomonas vaginalis G3]|eukprot:XP_001308972.1 ankyrin repeat protein [Trichomonas vaginalis G3]